LLRRRHCGFAWFDAGASDRIDVVAEGTLSRAARAAGMDVEFHVRPGTHTFWVFRPAFADAYPWIVTHLDRAPACRSATRAA
jgi:S-formylglutathione hydrolase FrmB